MCKSRQWNVVKLISAITDKFYWAWWRAVHGNCTQVRGGQRSAIGWKDIERGVAGFFARLVAALYKAVKSECVSRKTARWSLDLVHSHTALMTPRVMGPRVRSRATKCEVFGNVRASTPELACWQVHRHATARWQFARRPSSTSNASLQKKKKKEVLLGWLKLSKLIKLC